jgi:hypothetical protein
MGYDLQGKGGYFRWTGRGWASILGYALDNGWQPCGTGPPRGTLKKQWDGNYIGNAGQLFYARDAKRMADRLERFVAETRKRRHAKTRKDSDPRALRDPEFGKNVRKFIAYCRRGSFRIY